MMQDDFRQMVSSREAKVAKQSSYGGKRNLSEADMAEIKKLLVKKPKNKDKKPKHAMPTDALNRLSPPSQYRDRAAERRKGTTGDMAELKEYRHLDIEQSKFLGGDLEHTHLVKGLDFALLGQLKREKQQLLATKQKQLDNTTSSGVQKMSMPQNGNITFKTRLGRLVHYHACQSTFKNTESTQSELFLPGRMYYTFILSRTEVESIPVSVQCSKEDAPVSDDVVSGFVDDSLIGQVVDIMKMKQTGKLKHKRVNDHHHSPAVQQSDGLGHETEIAMDETKAAVDDEDIFPDLEEYVPIDLRSDDAINEKLNKETIAKVGYFSNLSAALTEKEDVARKKEKIKERAWEATLENAVESQKRVEREKERREKAARMTGEGDDYAEYQSIGALGGDSDNEDDEETVRRRKAAGLQNRKDLSDPEERIRRKKQKQSSKLANALHKINKNDFYAVGSNVANAASRRSFLESRPRPLQWMPTSITQVALKREGYGSIARIMKCAIFAVAATLAALNVAANDTPALRALADANIAPTPDDESYAEPGEDDSPDDDQEWYGWGRPRPRPRFPKWYWRRPKFSANMRKEDHCVVLRPIGSFTVDFASES
ncbi:hypothetical protein CCR75_000167 [Bremia lactucae]|uniref:RED-like N-terminal domain-containing protein n=1 Tax=Bremia lactucae TaxID=4779 RepID=A0A976IF82_BRELC|nr:hypothetical protein CCR75_000167 [Bremia lactucae]